MDDGARRAHEFLFNEKRLAAMHVRYAMHMVESLDDAARGRADHDYRAAALEAQLVNVRALVDFLGDQPPSSAKDDVTAHAYLPTWTGVAGDDLRDRLITYRRVVNKYVAHLTWSRVRERQEPDPDLSPMADDVRRAFDQFRQQLQAFDPAAATDFDAPVV